MVLTESSIFKYKTKILQIFVMKSNK